MEINISNQQTADFFKKQPLLKGLDDIELSYLVDIAEKILVGPHQLIFAQGEVSDDLYFIYDGEVAIFNRDENGKEYLLAKLSSGETFGELAFFDNAPRSSNVRAVRESLLIKISKEASHSHSTEMNKVFHQIGNNIAKVTLERIRLTNASSVENTSHEISNLQNRIFHSKLFVEAVLLYWIFGILAKKIESPYSQSGIQALFVSVILLISIIRHYASINVLKDFGIKLLTFSNGLKQTLWIMCGIGAITVINYFLGHYIHLVYPQMHWAHFMPIEWNTALLLYPIIVIMKEFIARGVIQTSLENILIDDKFTSSKSGKVKSLFENRNGKAAIVTALILAAFYLDYGIVWALIAFFINLLLCWSYIKIRNIFGTSLIHIVIGILLIVMNLLPQSLLYKI